MSKIGDLDFLVDESLPGMTCFTEAGEKYRYMTLILTFFSDIVQAEVPASYWIALWTVTVIAIILGK